MSGLRQRWLRVIALGGLAAVAWPAQAKVVESRIEVPVSVQDSYGKRAEQNIHVTLFVDDATPLPRSIMVINHGRAVSAEDRAQLGRARYGDNSRYFAGLGFVVAVPTRVGYGVSGGDDVEDSGDCRHKRYPAGYLAAAEQTRAVLHAIRAGVAGVRGDRSVVVGQSYGGMTAVTVAALNLEGVVAAINFAGGGGGNPRTRLAQPCSPEMLERLFGQYGRSARIPMLWVYTENDRYFGPEHPRSWFKAYQAGGAAVRMVQFPPHGEDGHSLFTRFPEVWKPDVESFLREQGFKWENRP